VRSLAALALALAGVAGLSGLASCYSYSGGSRPIDPARVTIDDGWVVASPTPVFRQREAIDCGPTALAMIAARWRVRLTVAEAVAALPKPPPEGSSMGELRDLARQRGLSAFALAADRETILHELRAGRPVLVGLFAPYGKYVQSHYEVVMALRPSDGQVATIDPARGWRTRSWKDLDAEWQPAGRPALVVLGPSAAPQPVAAR
jgi:ABC-type bacteriocin/lantibiotic exporter with double-glycine peptidase domain